MATNTFYLRPSADISLEHPVYPETLSAGYLAINDDVNDYYSATYIGFNSPPGAAVEYTSKFEMGLSSNKQVKINRVVSAALSGYGECSCGNDTNGKTYTIITIYVADIPITTIKEIAEYMSDGGYHYVYQDDQYVGGGYGSDSWHGNSNFDLTNVVTAINNSINSGALPSVVVEITNSTECTSTSTKNGGVRSYVSMVYLSLECEYDHYISKKMNEKWIGAISAYKKENGIWEKVDVLDTKSTIQNNHVSIGHHQLLIPAVAATCLYDGSTEGCRCSQCGEFIIQPETIPATGHATFVPDSGNHMVCPTCGYVDGLGYVELTYHGAAPNLSQAKSETSTTTVGNYALFGGGYIGNTAYYATVDVYDSSLTKTTATDLSEKKHGTAATTVGNYALFGGGSGNESGGAVSNQYATVDAYNTSLTKTSAPDLSSARYFLDATTVGNYALFGGGCDGSNYYAAVDVYDSSLTKTTATDLSIARSSLISTTVGNYALFGAGAYGSISTNMDAYNKSLTKVTVSNLTRSSDAATTVGNYALFGGGMDLSSTYATVDAYNTSLTKTQAQDLSFGKIGFKATTVGNYALFGRGSNDVNADVYNHALTKTIEDASYISCINYDSATVGNYALFGGGYNSVDTYYSSVFAYKIQPIS